MPSPHSSLLLFPGRTGNCKTRRSARGARGRRASRDSAYGTEPHSDRRDEAPCPTTRPGQRRAAGHRARDRGEELRGRNARWRRGASQAISKPRMAKRSDVCARLELADGRRLWGRRTIAKRRRGGPPPSHPFGPAAGAWRLRLRARGRIARTTRAGHVEAPSGNWPNRNPQNVATPSRLGLAGEPEALGLADFAERRRGGPPPSHPFGPAAGATATHPDRLVSLVPIRTISMSLGVGSRTTREGNKEDGGRPRRTTTRGTRTTGGEYEGQRDEERK